MTAKLSPRHRGDVKPITPISDFSDTFGAFGRRGVAVASATGVALTAVVAATGASTVPSVVPQAPVGDFTSNLEVTDQTTLVSLDLEWDSGDTVAVTAEEPPPPPEPEPVVEEEVVASRDYERSEDNAGASAAPAEQYSAPAAPASRLGSVVATAYQFLGVPYVFGGSSPAGFDCSGFTSYVYAMHGVSLPRTSFQQAGVGHSVSLAEAQPGDLIISNGAGHVGIYVGDGMMIHSPRPGKSVEVSSVAYFNIDSIRRL